MIKILIKKNKNKKLENMKHQEFMHIQLELKKEIRLKNYWIKKK